MTSEQTVSRDSVPELHVGMPDGRVFRFSHAFHVGREHECEVRLDDVHVSRKHLLVTYAGGRWTVRDLKSANGVFVNGKRVESATIDRNLILTLGVDGPALVLELEPQGVDAHRPLAPTLHDATSETRLLASYEERYFGSKAAPGRVGGRTMMIRRAFENVQKKQKRRYSIVIGVVALAAMVAGGYAAYKSWQANQQQEIAEELFYKMKALDVDLARLEQRMAPSDAEGRQQVRRYLARRRELESTYDRFISVLNLYDQKLSEEDRLILRITRLFGECELAAPSEYIREVKAYIKRWQSSDRFARGVKLAQEMGYTRPIADALLAQNLPAQYFYLALQESNFDPFISGPRTRWGIAKGMWQFIPETGARYGLTIGPLANVGRPDPLDDRNKWQKATEAASHYLKDIYATDAQASGLLVIASYNWGEHRIIDLLKTMPENPQERNFWKILEKYKHRVPQQTYDYVFYIVSAAVIGENPRLFGFPLDNPLGFLEKQHSSGAAPRRPAAGAP